MSTGALFKELARKYLKPSVPRHSGPSVLSQTTRIRDLRRAQPNKQLARAPSIFPKTEGSVVWRESEKYHHMTKRRQSLHLRRWRMPVNILGGEKGRSKPIMPFTWMQLSMGNIKEIEKAGGLEAKMISTSSARFSNEGKLLRNALFSELHRMNKTYQKNKPVEEEYEAYEEDPLQIESPRSSKKDKKTRKELKEATKPLEA